MRTKSGISPSFLAMAAVLLITLVVYFRGLTGGFLFDDFHNIVTNERVHLTALDAASLKDLVASGSATSMGRPLAMLSFGINHYLNGLDPWYFKLVNVLIHLVCGLLVYHLSQEILSVPARGAGETERPGLVPLLVAASWLLLPLNVSTVLFVVQRMTQLSACSPCLPY